MEEVKLMAGGNEVVTDRSKDEMPRPLELTDHGGCCPLLYNKKRCYTEMKTNNANETKTKVNKNVRLEQIGNN